jgi:hypothetical protein
MRPIGLVRLAIVLAMSISWFALANHCALAVMVAPAAEPSHSCCPENKAADKAPAKGKKQESGECCKTLHATLVPVAKQLTDFDASFALHSYFVALVVFPNTSGFMPGTGELDTGPPGENSFTHLVLQRSILAHAPPISLS